MRKTDFSITDSPQVLIIKTSLLSLEIQKKDGSMKLINSDKIPIVDFTRNFADFFEDKINQVEGKASQKRIALGAEFKMNSNMHFYGLGEKARGQFDQSLDWRGKKRDLFGFGETMGNQFDGADGGANGNIMIPFLVTNQGAGVFLDTAYRTYWEFDDPKQEHWYVKQDCDQEWEKGQPKCERAEMRFYFIAGNKPLDAISRYTELTGKPLMPPRWFLGFMQSKYGYNSWKEVEDDTNSLRSSGFPLEGLFLDLQWFGAVPGTHGPDGEVLPQYSSCEHRKIGSFTWSKSSEFDFSDSKTKLSQFLSKGIHILPIEEGYFDTCLNGKDGRGNSFVDAESRGFLARSSFDSNKAAVYANGVDSSDSQFGSTGYFGQISLIDTSTPESREWFWSKHLPILKDGASMFWTDLGEPERNRWWWKYANGLWHQDIHNVWDLNRARGIYEGYKKDLPHLRPFVLSRSGYAGSQRYGVGIWSADAPTRLGWAAAQISSHLNLAISGLPYVTSDIGGFGGYPVSNGAQFTRWMQLEAFSSLMRAHGNTSAGENKKRIVLPNGFGEPYTSINRKYVQWRTALVPYLYTLAREAFDHGWPIVRAIPLLWPNDPDGFNLGSEFMVGNSMLVAPVILGSDNRPDVSRDIYLPEGEWIDLHTKQLYSGKRWLKNFPAPLEILPLFARKGSTLPKGPIDVPLSDPRWMKTRIFEIYPNEGNSTFELYDDDGESNKYYSAGKEFSKTLVTTKKDSHSKKMQVNIGKMVGDFKGKPETRNYSVEIMIDSLPNAVAWNGKSIPIANISSGRQTSSQIDNAYYESKSKMLTVLFSEVKTNQENVLNISY